MIEIKDLTLTVERQVPGELVTNALAIKSFVEERLKDFSADKYVGDADAAKKDRAVLNNAAKELDSKRLQLEREFMAPLDEFKKIIKETTNLIKDASTKLDEIVKQKEAEEKELKKQEIKNIFDSKHFNLLPFEQFLESHWLNKTAKIKDVEEEINKKIKKIASDIETIEALGDDQLIARVKYLETLDLSQAIAAAKAAKETRERLEKEKEDKIERQIEAQREEIKIDANVWRKEESTASLAAQALDIEEEPLIEYTLRLRGTRSALIAVRKYMTELGITYEKL